MMPSFTVGDRQIGADAATYFIADISANHDGDVERAKALIHLAAEAGADAAKFQNFEAAKIVSQKGFEDMGGQLSHQAGWKKSVFEVYEDASLPAAWTQTLKAECDAAGVDYFSTPYDAEAVDMLDEYVEVFKIGSGDVTWLDMLRDVAGRGKPVFIATGASDMRDVQRAMRVIQPLNDRVVLMQCNTNYTASLENFRHIHLDVLKSYALAFPTTVLGLSDHTPGHATVLGAVALGARVVEKHFTDDTSREGPDHSFSMDPGTWRDMVGRTRELERALGSAEKFVAENEAQTVVVQRRALRAARDLDAGVVLGPDDLEALRPCPADGLPPYELPGVVGGRLRAALPAGQHLRWTDLEPAEGEGGVAPEGPVSEGGAA